MGIAKSVTDIVSDGGKPVTLGMNAISVATNLTALGKDAGEFKKAVAG